jgi:hypothetical protein
VRALAVIACLPLLGCFEAVDGGACGSDNDCPGAACTRVGECAEQPYALRVSWTIAGQPASGTACAGISELELSIIDPSTGTAHTVRPVPRARLLLLRQAAAELHRRAAVVVRAVGTARRLRQRQRDRQQRRADARPHALTSATR